MSFKFKKSLGQNFIYDEGFLNSIVCDLGLSKDDVVIEVGTGAGTLTRVLARKVSKVITFEVDTQLQDILQKQLNEFDNVTLNFKDALEADIKSHTDAPFKLVANIPYYITTPLILKFLETPNCVEINVLIQDDVAKRIVASPNTKEYGALSVAVQCVAHCKIVRNVPRHIFKPIPNVDSCFVQIIKKQNGGAVDAKLLKGMFSARRKTVLNALKQTLAIDTKQASDILAACGIKENIRPENLSIDNYIELSRLAVR